MRSGSIDGSNGRLRFIGLRGYAWSSSALTYVSSTDAGSLDLRFDVAGVAPSNGASNRWSGFSLRCAQLVLMKTISK